MMVDGESGIMPVAPTFVPEDSAAKNAVANAAVNTAASNSSATQAALIRLTSGATLTDAERALLGMVPSVTPSTVIDNKPKWVKASTVNTANGPVDVDANGLAQDGTKPVAVVAKGNETFLTRNGFTPGPFPKGLEQYFGSSAGILGWKIITNADGSQQLEVADSENSSKTFGFKFKSDGSGNYTQFNTSNAGGIGGNGNNTVLAGSTGTTTAGGPTLAVNTFKNTLALFFGTSEMAKPWVDELYKLVNPYYKSGSSIDEALNMAIQEGRNNPNLKEFTARFKGIYDLQDKLLKGVAVTVPTIAEFVATEAKMGDVLNQAGLSSLNQQSYLGDIIGKGVNVTEFTNRINNVFLRIDQLPQQAKDFISGSFPTLDKTQLAKAILGGEKGAIELSKELSGLEVQAAGKAQGIGVSTATGLDIAARGFGYQEALTGFGTVAQSLPTYEKLQEISSGKDIKTEQAQAELQGLVFNKSIVDSMRAEQLANQEVARFRSSSGLAGSKSLASQQRGAGLI